jgi:hypothetical protein
MQRPELEARATWHAGRVRVELGAEALGEERGRRRKAGVAQLLGGLCRKPQHRSELVPRDRNVPVDRKEVLGGRAARASCNHLEPRTSSTTGENLNRGLHLPGGGGEGALVQGAQQRGELEVGNVAHGSQLTGRRAVNERNLRSE